MRRWSSHRPAAGFALLEALVSLVIMMVGLLGLMSLQMNSVQAQTEAYQRQQALILIQDIIDRINANHATAGCYDLATATSGAYLGTGADQPINCAGFGSAETQSQAVRDLTEWNGELLGLGERQDGNSVGAMIGARGCITRKDPVTRVYTVAIAWQGLRASTAPADACASGLYGDERLRRAVAVDVRIANLTAP